MLQIPDHHLFKKNKPYAELAQQYLSDTVLQTVVTAAMQQAALQRLDAHVKKEQFYFITDVKTGAITNCNGISKWLGYTDAHFSKKNYLACFNAPQILLQGFYAAALFEVLINKQLSLQFLQPSCVTTLALKHKDGNFLYCKRQCYPFQLTHDGKMTAYVNEFTLIKELGIEEYHTRIYDEVDKAQQGNENLKKIAKKNFEDARAFSVQELRILKRYANDENITSENIAKSFKIEKTTVDTYNKRILKKVEAVFGQRFTDAKNVAAYFKRVGLV